MIKITATACEANAAFEAPMNPGQRIIVNDLEELKIRSYIEKMTKISMLSRKRLRVFSDLRFVLILSSLCLRDFCHFIIVKLIIINLNVKSLFTLLS